MDVQETTDSVIELWRFTGSEVRLVWTRGQKPISAGGLGVVTEEAGVGDAGTGVPGGVNAGQESWVPVIGVDSSSEGTGGDTACREGNQGCVQEKMYPLMQIQYVTGVQR